MFWIAKQKFSAHELKTERSVEGGSKHLLSPLTLGVRTFENYFFQKAVYKAFLAAVQILIESNFFKISTFW